jgi:hypothetical protein
MNHHNAGVFRSRIIFTAIVLPVLIAGPMIFAFYLYSKRVMMDSHLAKAKAICLTADNAKSYHGCEFSGATAGDNSFDLTFTDRRSLSRREMDDNLLSNFHVFDRSENLLLYTHFVKARKTCLDCHGDPGKSKKVWASDDGPKELSNDLIGWSEGDICGAYKVSAELASTDKKAASASAIAALMLLAGTSIYSLAFCDAWNRRPGQGDKMKIDNEKPCLDSEIFDLGQTNEVRHRVH